MDFSTIRRAALHAPIENMYASMSLHSAGTKGSFAQGFSNVRASGFVAETVGDGVGVEDVEGVGVGIGVAVLLPCFLTNTPLLHTNFPLFFIQEYS
jgi:hypothetical protein